MKKTKIIMRLSMGILGLVVIGLVVVRLMHMNHGGHVHQQHPALVPTEGMGSVGSFELINQDGEKYGSSNLKGDTWVANFIFTRCQGPCPIISSRMAALQKDFDNTKNLSFVSFSVDPTYDTPERLSQYAEKYRTNKTNWQFLTGGEKEIYELIREKFHLAVKDSEHIPHENDENQILHSLHFVLVDKDGGIQGYYNSNDPEAVSDLKVKLKNQLNLTS